MARRPSTARKTLSEANLAALGADRLAALLIEVANGDLKRRLRMELAAEVGAPDLALELDKRLTTLAASRARVSWRKRPELIADLQMLRRMIVGRLAPMDAKLAFDRLAAWFDLYPSLAARVKDPKGELTLVFDGATADLASLASAVGPDVAAPVLTDALSTRLSEWASWVGRGAAALSPDLARRLLADLTRAGPRPTGRLALVVRKLADRAGDIDAWVLAIPDEDRRKPDVAAGIARRLAEAGRAEEARAALEASRTESPPASRWGRARTVEPAPLPESWHAAEIAVLEAEGQTARAEEARWTLFGRTLSDDTLRTLLAGLPDFEDVIALDRAFALAGAHVDPMKGLAFLMTWPAHREAAAMILARREEIRGLFDDLPLWAARLAGRYPDAALLLVRARAEALVRLGDGMTDGVEGLIGEAETLAVATGEDSEIHAAFIKGLRSLAATKRPAGGETRWWKPSPAFDEGRRAMPYAAPVLGLNHRKSSMRARLVSLAALLAVVAPPLTLAGVAAAQTPVTAEGAQAPELPAAPVADLVSRVNIPWSRFTLDNGLTVIVHTDRKAPVVAVSIWYNVGSKDEPAGSTGFAHLFEHLMFGGSENSPNSHLQAMRGAGATSLNGTTWFDRTNYFETVPTPALEQTLFLESDRMGYLLGQVGQEVLDLQRGVVQNEKRQGDNQPYGLFEYAQLEALFPEGHPYRHSTIGSMADLDAASLETVRGWFRENYGPNNAVLVLSGDIDEPTARTLVQKYFGAIPRGPVNTPAEAAIPTLAAPVSAVMRDRVANVRLTRSWAVPGLLDEDTIPLSVGASVLGGLASSRLDNELVRGDQSAVSASASVSDFHRLGIFDISVDVKPGQDPAAVNARLDAILADLIANGPTDEEVARVATSYASRQIQSLEQVNGKASVLAEGQLYAGDPDHYKHQLEAYASVTPAQVQAALRKWLSRPVYSLTIEPGEREAYAEAAASPSGAAPVAAAAIERIARDPMPVIGAVSDLSFPAIERTRLSNGVPVVYARSATVPVTRVAVEFDAGYAADRADRLGAHSLMLDLMDDGTTTRSSTQLAQEEERLGASINVGASMDRSAANLTAVTTNLRPSLALLADVVRNPAFAPGEVERLRNQRLSSIASERTNPNALAIRALPPLLYGEESPYGRPFTGTGDETSIAALARADIVSEHQTWVRPDNATIFVVSDLPLDQVTPELEAAFGNWSAPAVPRGSKTFGPAATAGTSRIVLIDRPQSPQSLIYGGVVLPLSGTDDLLALNTANSILGTDFLSRINADLRETKGWSYGVRGTINQMQHQVPYLISAPVQANRTGESITALMQQYNAFLTTNGVTPPELERTINGNTRSLAGGFETSAQLLGALRSNALYGRPDDYYDTIASRTRALSAADLDAAARGAIRPEGFVWVVVGDAAVVKPQLDTLGLPVEVRSTTQ